MTETQLLLNAARILNEYIQEEFIKQGHELSGNWQRGFETNEITDGEVEGLAFGYGMVVNEGIKPERIPYGNGGGTVNKYILALQSYIKARNPGMSDVRSLKLAFATAEVQKVEGMSTIASERFSSNGQRQHFLENILAWVRDFLDEFIFDGLAVIIDEKSGEKKKMVW